MATELALIERELTSRKPILMEVLPKELPPQRLIRTIIIACEKTPRLLTCTMPSIISSAYTAAVLGLEVDGVTGQGFLVPYGGAATFQVGYKGYATIGARSGIAVNSGVVREGDDFQYELGTDGFVRHRPSLDGRQGRRIIAAWATGTAIGRPPIFAVMPYPDILEIMKKSAGAKKPESPWNDLQGRGHEAMCAKTAIRRMGSAVPVIAFQQAVFIDNQSDLGKRAYLRPDGATVIDADVVEEKPGSPYPRSAPIAGLTVDPRPKPEATKGVREIIAELRAMSKEQADQWAADNAPRLAAMAAGDERQRRAYEEMRSIIESKIS